MFDSYSWVDLSFITASCLLVGAMFHRKRQNKTHEHENRYVQESHRIDAHSPLQGFISLRDARNFILQPNCSPFVRNISGQIPWTFKLCDTFSEAVECLRSSQCKNGNEVPDKKKDFFRTSVPSQWQFFNVGDIPAHRAVSHIQEYDNILSNKNYNPSGYYCHYFHVPQKWDTRQIRLVFGGVDCAVYVWVNSLFVGFSKDSKLPAEFDVTEAAKFGEKNCVEAIVVKYSDAMLLENHATWRLNGIFRDVHLLSLPRPVCISDYGYIINDITNNSNEVGGRFLFTAKIKLNWDLVSADNHFGQESTSVYPRQNFVATSAEWILSSYLYHEGIMVSSTVGTVDAVDSSPRYFGFDKSTSKPISKVQEYVYLPTGSADSFPSRHSHAHNLQQFRDAKTVEEEETDYSHLSTPLATSANKITASILQVHEVKAPKLWSAERPNVYTLVMSLRNTTDGSVVQSESCRVAFRTVDVNYGLLRVNAKPVMIRGTNLQEHDPYRGNTLSPRVIEADIQLMKRSNINAIRTAGYPHSSWLYELCTLYGLYVVDEANICTNIGVGAGDGNVNILADELDWEKAYMTRLVRMYERDKTHASIIAWSLGSDSGYGRVHDKMAHWIGDRDTSRLVMYEPASYGPRLANGVHANIHANNPNKPNSAKKKHKRANVQMATDILCPKYARVSECIVLGNRYPDLPLILMEYSDMRGNSGGNLMDYWTAFNNYTRLQGGFLFTWADQGLSMSNSQQDSFWGGFGDFGGEISQTTTDPTYSRWGNNPPGQRSVLGLYPETALLQLAQRNSIKGRGYDDQYTPFTNGVRQGTTPYPYVRYGSKKNGVAANVYTAGGLTWSDRGILDKSIFEAHDPATLLYSDLSTSSSSSSSSSAGDVYADTDKLTSSRYPDMYGLTPPPLYHKSFYKLLFTTALSDDSLILSQAIAKPQLLEAKYCMTPFDCFIETVTVKESAVVPVVKNRYNYETAQYEPMAPANLPPPDCSFAALHVSTKLNVINLLDHVDDITDELTFDALLLCNGLVVGASTLSAQASAVVHRTYNEETGRPTFQELEALGDFELSMTVCDVSKRKNNGSMNSQSTEHTEKEGEQGQNLMKTICGIKCPEDILLVPYCKNDINDLINKASQEYKEVLSASCDQNHDHQELSTSGLGGVVDKEQQQSQGSVDYLVTTVSCSGCLWSVVVIGRTLQDTAWAPLGYPLGMKQCKISNKFFQPPQPPVKVSTTATSAIVSGAHVTNADSSGTKKNLKASKRPTTPKKRKSITNTPNTKKKYFEKDPPIASPNTRTGIPISRHVGKHATAAADSAHVGGGVGGGVCAEATIYDVSVLWVEQQSLPVKESSGKHEKDTDKDILLRAVAVGCDGQQTKKPVSVSGPIYHQQQSQQQQHSTDASRNNSCICAMPKLVEVRISGSTGCLLSYLVDGVELLDASTSNGKNSNSNAPSCFQLHRAPTVVDRGGYLTAWQAVGMDQAFAIQPLVHNSHSNSSSLPSSSSSSSEKVGRTKKNPPPSQDSPCPPVANKPITGSTNLHNVRVEHVFMHQPSTSPGHEASSSSSSGGSNDNNKRKNERSPSISENGFGQGVQCKWTMAPATVDKGRVLLLLQIQQFVNDSRVRSTVLEVRSNGQEAFVHEIAKTFRLGRESLSPYSEKNLDSRKLHTLNDEERASGMKAKVFLEFVKIRLWKVAFHPSSTIPYVDTLSIGPFGGLKYDEVDLNDDEEKEEEEKNFFPPSIGGSKRKNDIYSQAYYDSFDDNIATRLLTANSSPSHLTKPLRKNDRHLDLTSDCDADSSIKREQSNEKAKSSSSSSLRKLFSVKYCVVYLLDENATLLLHAQVDVTALPCPPPRIGLHLRVDPSVFSHANWLGHGPHENYPDRKFSCLMAVHSSPFSALGVPYMIPGENGARGGLEWLQLHNNGAQESRSQRICSMSSSGKRRTESAESIDTYAGGVSEANSQGATPSPPLILPTESLVHTCPAPPSTGDDDQEQKARSKAPKHTSTTTNNNNTIITGGGLSNRELVIRCSRPFSFGVLPYSTEQLINASNTADLLKHQRESSQACINIDPYMMGIGGDDTWSSCVHEDHILHPSKYEFQLAFSVRNDS